MVDNENQWEDMEYSDESGDMDESGNEEYSDQEYEAYDDEDYEEEDNAQTSAPKKGNAASCLIILIILLALIGAGAFIFLGKKGSNGAPAPSSSPVTIEENNSQQGENTTELGDAFFNEAGGENSDMMTVDFNAPGETTVTSTDGNEEIVATVMDAPNQNEGNTENQNSNVEDLFPSENDMNVDASQGSNEIMVAYNKKARLNPFKPPVITKETEDYTLIGGTEFEIIEPPTTSVVDENLTRLLQTQISGILYDTVSPSAIVNLNGVDHFVKVGDTVFGYKIESITRDRVQITYKNNTYVASVGELFTRGYLEKQQAVADLENKFAGRYRNNN